MPVELSFPRLPMLKNKEELKKGKNYFTQKSVPETDTIFIFTF